MLEDSKLTNLFIKKFKKLGLLFKRLRQCFKRLGDSVKRLGDSKLTNIFIFIKKARITI